MIGAIVKAVKAVKNAKAMKAAVKVVKDVKSLGGPGGSNKASGGGGDQFATQGATTPSSSPSKAKLIGQKERGGNPLHYGTHKARCEKRSKSKR